jgi:hypothetical protein
MPNEEVTANLKTLLLRRISSWIKSIKWKFRKIWKNE